MEEEFEVGALRKGKEILAGNAGSQASENWLIIWKHNEHWKENNASNYQGSQVHMNLFMVENFLHNYHIFPKSWLIFSHSHSKQSGKKLFFLRESSLWDMFKVLLFWRPALRQDNHVISGLFQGAKWFFFSWLEYKKCLILLERGKYAFLLFLFCERDSSLWCCWDVK